MPPTAILEYNEHMKTITKTNEIVKKRLLLLGGYFASLQDAEKKKRYLENLEILGGFDPYETGKSEWQDDVDLSPSITYTSVCTYCTLQVHTQEKTCSTTRA